VEAKGFHSISLANLLKVTQVLHDVVDQDTLLLRKAIHYLPMTKRLEKILHPKYFVIYIKYRIFGRIEFFDCDYLKSIVIFLKKRYLYE